MSDKYKNLYPMFESYLHDKDFILHDMMTTKRKTVKGHRKYVIF